MEYLSVLAKLVLGSLMLIVYARLGGRSQVNPMSGTEVVSGMVVGAMISGSLFDDSVPVWAVGAVIAVWTVLFLLLRKVKKASLKAERLVDGEAVRLIFQGEPVHEGFEQLNLSLTDFGTMIRQAGILAISELDEVWQETNGKLTIVKKGETPPAVLLVERGAVHRDGLRRIGRDEHWLKQELLAREMPLEAVFCAEFFKERLFVYPVPGPN